MHLVSVFEYIIIPICIKPYASPKVYFDRTCACTSDSSSAKVTKVNTLIMRGKTRRDYKGCVRHVLPIVSFSLHSATSSLYHRYRAGVHELYMVDIHTRDNVVINIVSTYILYMHLQRSEENARLQKGLQLLSYIIRTTSILVPHLLFLLFWFEEDLPFNFDRHLEKSFLSRLF